MSINKVLYLVSTLSRSGPTNQLLNIIRNLDKNEFEPIVITLSPEPKDTLKPIYDELGIKVYSLRLSRIQGLLKAKKRLKEVILKSSPKLIHTQGLRADSLMSKIDLDVPWVMTARNYPFDDYPMKFGKIKGTLMAYSHISSMRHCKNVVACSKTIASQLGLHKIKSVAIQNGVYISPSNRSNSLGYEYPVFISVGSLIPRKNMKFIVEAFNYYLANNKGSLIILGDGSELAELKKQAKSKNIHIEGAVNNVRDYLEASDYFISASLSEGLPNTVLEGFAAGLPALLSDIPSHMEIEQESDICTKIFKLSDNPKGLLEKLCVVNELFTEGSSEEAYKLSRTIFSDSSMSKKYQDLYHKII